MEFYQKSPLLGENVTNSDLRRPTGQIIIDGQVRLVRLKTDDFR
jgi:hypothetical protein